LNVFPGIRFSEGKIKVGGVTPMLTHCLHIVFRDSTTKRLGVTGFVLFPALLGKSGGVTFYEPAFLSSPLFMYQFDLESLARADAYLGTDVALCDCTA